MRLMGISESGISRPCYGATSQTLQKQVLRVKAARDTIGKATHQKSGAISS